MKLEASYEPLVKMLASPERRARFFAAGALGKLGKPAAIESILNVLRENADQDAVLRFGCATALANLGDTKPLVAAAKDPSPAVRLGALLALRRLERPECALFLKDEQLHIVLEAARAINDLPIEGALPQLAELLDHPLPKRGRSEDEAAEHGRAGPDRDAGRMGAVACGERQLSPRHA